jgi:hypothetical protein
LFLLVWTVITDPVIELKEIRAFDGITVTERTIDLRTLQFVGRQFTGYKRLFDGLEFVLIHRTLSLCTAAFMSAFLCMVPKPLYITVRGWNHEIAHLAEPNLRDHEVEFRPRQTQLKFPIKSYNIALLCCSFAPICLCLVKYSYVSYTAAKCTELTVKLFCMLALLIF